MGPATQAMLLEFIIIPLIKELLERRGIHGATPENLKSFGKDPEKMLAVLKADPGLQHKVTEELADAIDNIGGDAINAIGHIFKAVTPGGEDDS